MLDKKWVDPTKEKLSQEKKRDNWATEAMVER